MNTDNKDKQELKPGDGNGNKFGPYWIYAVILLAILGVSLFNQDTNPKYETNTQEVYAMMERGDVDKVKVMKNNGDAYVFIDSTALSRYPNARKAEGWGSKGAELWHLKFEILNIENFDAKVGEINQRLLADNKDSVTLLSDKDPEWIGQVLWFFGPILLLILLWVFIMRRMGGGAGGPGGQIFNIGKSRATLFDKNTKVNVTFKDVAGLDEAKEEVMEVVDFLKNPKKYTSLGGKIPKGVLLVGPPGTGKTLLAKAVAGEAAVPFFSISGSDFVEMFVGVGASRVRDLFKQAREKAPCIIFIDEIDAIGRARGRGAMQGNDERENTLNQLLVEMDGFSSDKGVILMAATNRPDVLDSALLRPGRFDRQIGIDRPDLKGREQIFKVHLKNIKNSDEVNAHNLAEMTPGFAGADIANICNEAALVAARRNKKAVDMDDFNYALDRIIGGLEKKNKLISPKEKKVIAYHEAGHAICGWFLEHASPLVKVTIVPRGIGTLGYAQYLPKDEYITTEDQLLDRMCMTLGGRAAEKIIFNKISTGAQSDLDQVTKMSYGMISIYGMNAKVGNVSFYDMQNQNQFAKPYSDQTNSMIDEEVRNLIEGQYERAQQLLIERKDELELLANQLLEKEVLLKSDVERLVGKRPFEEEEGQPFNSVEESAIPTTDTAEEVDAVAENTEDTPTEE